MLRNAVWLAARSLWWYRGRTITIVLCLAVTLWAPLTVRLLVRQFQADILDRARSTPLIIGTKGSRIDLVLHGLYFEAIPPEFTTMREATYVRESGFAQAIPLHIRFRTQSAGATRGAPIVGTSLEYFEFRRLTIQHGQPLTRLGDCILGAGFAAQAGLSPGDSLLSAPRNAFNLAGDYPLKMQVAGVFYRTHTPDDDAVFVDLKTAWIIEGIGHGHQKLTFESADQLLKSNSAGTLTANASVLPYMEVTDENEAAFHFHGDEEDYPVSEIIALPKDRQAQTMLLGRYASVRQSNALCMKPGDVVDDLLSMVFRIEQLFRIAAVVSTVVTLLLLGLVVFLSVRLREPEMTTMQRIGSARGTTALLIGTEMLLLLVTAIGLSVGTALMTEHLASGWLRHLLF